MSSAFQPNAFQPNGFQIGNFQPSGTATVIDQVAPIAAASAITTIIVLSQFVFVAPVAATPVFDYGTPQPPVRAPRPVQRPYDGYVFAPQQPDVSAQDFGTKRQPVIQPKSVRPYDGSTFVPQQPNVSAQSFNNTRLVSMESVSTPIIVSDVFIPPSVAGSGYPAGLPGPTSLVPAGGTTTTIVQSECYTPPTPVGSGYPNGLEPPIKPVNPLPPRPRAHDAGTVGVAFPITTYDYGWNNPLFHPLPKAPVSPRFSTDPFMPAVIPPTYDYGWFTQPQRPTQLKPSNARNLPPDLHFALGNTYDFGWFSPPQMPVQLKPSPARNLPQDVFLILPAGTTYDYGWFAAPQLPTPPKPWMAHNLCPEYFPWENAKPTEELRPHGGHYPEKLPKLKKKKHKPAPWELSNEEVRASLMKVVDAAAQRKIDALERQDEEDLLRLLDKMGLL